MRQVLVSADRGLVFQDWTCGDCSNFRRILSIVVTRAEEIRLGRGLSRLTSGLHITEDPAALEPGEGYLNTVEIESRSGGPRRETGLRLGA